MLGRDTGMTAGGKYLDFKIEIAFFRNSRGGKDQAITYVFPISVYLAYQCK
jgi:hypothetical protein